MKRVILRSLLPVLLVSAFTSPSHSQDEQLKKLSPEHLEWLEEEVVYIILEREREVFLQLETLEEREQFIEAFWRLRDPDRATPENEFKEEHYRRLEYANKFFGRDTFLPGWRTDRGQMYIILGEPLEIQTYSGKSDLRELQLWFNSGDPTKGLPSYFYLLFFKRYDVGTFELYHPVADGPNALVTRPHMEGANAGPEAALGVLARETPELARAALGLGPSEPGWDNTSPSLGSEILFAGIHDSPKRAIRADYLDGWLEYGDLVSSEYSFNFVPSRSYFAVLSERDGTPFVSYGVEIDPQHFTMATDEDETKFYTTLDISVEARNEEGVIVLANDWADYLELSPSQFLEVRARPFSYQGNFPLLPGAYTINVILRSRVNKQYTVAETNLVVPPLPSDKPSFSDVILGYSVEALMSSSGGGAAGELRTFQLGSAQVLPAAEGVFSLNDTVHVFLQVLGASRDAPLHFELLDGEEVLLERTTRVSTYLGEPVVERFSLRGMSAGTYTFRVRLLDPAGGVLAEATADCQISPRTAIDRPWVKRISFGTNTPGLVALARGDQFLARKLLPQAKTEFENAVSSGGPAFPMARWKLASISIQTGEPARALELLTPIEQNFPNQYEVIAGLGLGYSLQGDCTQGTEYLERATSLRAPDITLLNVLGECYTRLGETENAVDAFQRSLNLNPEQKQVQERLAALRPDNN